MKTRLESLLEMFSKDPKDSFLKYGIALEYVALKDYSKAEEFFLSIFKDDPNYIPAYMQLGIMKSNQGKTEEAKKIFLQGIAVARKEKDTHAVKEMEEFLDELN